MSIEIHAWVALATSNNEWDDGDFADAFDQVERLIASLPTENGYEAILSDAGSFPRMVYLKGIDVDASETVEQLIQQIATVFDRSYGELAVADGASLEAGWDPRHISRYCIASGEVRPV